MSSPTGEIYRVDWLPGTDVLHGTCHCGAEHASQDPIEMWEWMLGHPEGHEPQAHEPQETEPRGTEPRGSTP
ncbi:hypothetical protein [Streptomyces sp. NPDC050263]|uniref:hypothetical protein n=1 Tax=Streptomyces sp. NPDC050263 TaxID=3155037 RepID=UPI0034423CEF